MLHPDTFAIPTPHSLTTMPHVAWQRRTNVPIQADWIAEVSELRALAAIAETQSRLTLDRVTAKAFEQMAAGYRQKAVTLENAILQPN
jgi:hypothetical protein